MKIDNNQLISTLLDMTAQFTTTVAAFKELDLETLRSQPSPNSWNILACIEHLNLYGDFYLPEIEKQILANQQKKGSVFKSGWLGNYFVNLIQRSAQQKQLSTTTDKNPTKLHLHLNIATLDRFLKQQERLTKLLLMAKPLDLSRIKTAVSISKFISLRLGDTLRFVVYHNHRHIKQALACQKVI